MELLILGALEVRRDGRPLTVAGARQRAVLAMLILRAGEPVSGEQMAIGYVLVPLVIAGLIRFLPESLDKLTAPYIIALIVFGFPLLVLLAFVLPVAGVVSLLRSYREFREGPLSILRRPLEWILLSQIAGGTLAILFAPVLAVLAPNSLLQSVLTVVNWALGLMTPIAFALAVFKFKVLDLNPD